MKLKEFMKCSAALIGLAFMFCSCVNDKEDIKLPDDKKAEQLIGQIIEDRVDNLTVVSENDSEIVWQANLPDRNDLKVHFTFYKTAPANGIDGSRWQGRSNWE